MQIVLNRTLIYASLRRPTRLSLKLRAAIRIVPIILFAHHVFRLAIALRCQTSPNLDYEVYPIARAIPASTDDIGTPFYWLARALTPFYPHGNDDTTVCQLAGMLPPTPDTPDSWTPSRGSLKLLHPLFRSIAISLFVNTFTHALTSPSSAGGTIFPSTSSDTGLTLFEDSLAFAEAEAFIDPVVEGLENVHPEVLYVAVISAMAHLVMHLIGVFVPDRSGARNAGAGSSSLGRYRLVTTGVWGGMFLAGFVWAVYVGDGRILRFPTVCIVGFTPHLVVGGCVLLCAGIYLAAAIVATISPPPPSNQRENINDTERHGLDFTNLQANPTVSSLTIARTDDFYTTLLKLGFSCLTAASDATYLSEAHPVAVPRLTWLEREQLRVMARQRLWDTTRSPAVMLKSAG